ncbi:hypothetical protein BC834DRAFT_974977 [Gloeopeniophorella convolvens]|nr:hypothetical protein BC834DRAFT_974977 [Gloeopeniophorella convolvens]
MSSSHPPGSLLVTNIVGDSYKPDQSESTQTDILTMGSLPDVTLLEVFDFYQLLLKTRHSWDWKWHVLAQVCRRWRQLILASPEHLKVRCYLAPGLPIAEILRCSPLLPLTIRFVSARSQEELSIALEQFDRIRLLALHNVLSFNILTPCLTHFDFTIGRTDQTHVPLIIQVLESVYSMHELEDLCLSFWPAHGFSFDADQQVQAKTPTSHPVLSEMSFLGTSALFEYFICKVDAPALEILYVNIVDRPPITIPSLSRFINNLVPRVTGNEARVRLTESLLCVETPPLVFDDATFLTIHGDHPRIRFCIHYDDWIPHLPTLMATVPAICKPFTPALSHVESLFIECGDFINHEEPWVEVPYAEG